MYIRKVEINNIRSVREFKMEIPAGLEAGWHVLIGDNGAGKSTIVRSIALAIIGPVEVQALRLPLINWIRKDGPFAGVYMTVIHDKKYDLPKENENSLLNPIEFGVSISRELNAGVEIGRLTYSGKYVHGEEHVWSGRPGWFATSFGPFRRFTGGDKEWSKVYISNPRVAAHLSAFGEDVALTESLDWLSTLKFRSLEFNKSAISTLEALKKFINGGANKGGLLPHGVQLNEVTSSGIFFKDANGFDIDVTQMSDGFRSLISMIFELIRQMVKTYGEHQVFKEVLEGNPIINLPGVVLIDEIDAHLHPTWQTRIGQWFTKYFPNLQFIVTTHSPLICRGCVDEEGKINGTIWRLAAPGSNEESGLLSDIDRDRLIHGNVLDAYGTGAFGENIERTKAAQALLKELAQLDKLHTFGQITPEQDQRRLELQKIFTTDVISDF